MPGKDPHRPQGKTMDAEHMMHTYASDGVPRQAPSAKEVADQDIELMEQRGDASSMPEQVGGSRPGVESRVKAAIEEREARGE